jgi:outer membrane protein assembly factor BamB
MTSFSLRISVTSLILSSAGVADWPQWRGPNRDGVSADTTPIAEVLPESGLRKVWESEFIPSDHYGGHGSPVVAGEQVFLSVVWHERVPSEKREIDSEVMQQLNYRGTSPELAKKLEADRLALSPRLRGDKLEEWINEWRKANLTPKEDVSLGSWVASRFKAGKTAIALEWLDKVSNKQGKPFASADEFKKWLDEEGFPADLKEKMLSIVPNTIKVAKDVVICLDLNTGKTVWKYEAEGTPTGRKSSSTAAVVDGRVYALCSRMMHCVDQQSGKLIWKSALPGEGPGSSPLFVDGSIFVNAGRVAAYSAIDGKQIWEQKEVRADTASPLLWSPPTGKPVLVINTNSDLTGLDPATGAIRWKIEGGSQSTPVTSGDWLVVYSGTKDVGLRAYKHQAEGPPKTAWSHFWVTMRYSGSPLIHDGSVYLMCGGKHQCVDLASGEVKWKQDANSTITSPLLADGKILVLENNGSHLAILKAAPAAYQQLARAKVEGMGCTSPALSNGRLIVRQKDKLACFDLRPEK